MPDPVGPEEVTFTLDGREVTGRKGEMLIAAAERAGTFIPRFCYHPRMKSVGVCRMCLVEVSGPRGASLQPSCFVEVQDGATVVTDSDKVKKAQDGVLEFLLINHPLDCPVCDKGGECPLQDQTLAYGPGESRFVEEKRHFEKPIAISELVLLDRERCIQCTRCTRFAAEVAGEAQIDFLGRGEMLEVNIFPELPFSSYFSGNTVQICPVGALTASPYRFVARPWDLDQVESTCTTCSVGCRVAVQSSSNRVTRLLGIDAEPVNHGWLCDKGRFAFDAVNRDDRLREPLVRKHGELVGASWHEALEVVARGIEAAVGAGPETVGIIGGARLTNEGAYAWAKLAKGVIGTDSVDAQLGDGLPGELVVALPRATIADAVGADTVIVLSGDLREEVPVLFLRLRSAVVDGALALVELSSQATSLTPFAASSLRYPPGEATALVRALVDSAAAVPQGVDAAGLERARRLAGAEDVVVVAGRPSLAEDGALVAEAVQALAAGFPGARFLPALRRGNVQGALDMGLAPGLLPGRVGLEGGRDWFTEAWGAAPERRGRDTAGILAAVGPGQPDPDGAGPAGVRVVVLLGADPLGDFPDRRLAAEALDAAELVVAVASAPGPTTELADVVLPVAEAHERVGTTTNLEGRVSRVAQKLVPPGQSWPDWMVAAELAVHLGHDLGFTSSTEIWDEIERLAPSHRGLTRAVLDGPREADGLVVPLSTRSVALGGSRPSRLDPIAFPGVESVEWQGAPPRVGTTGPAGPTGPTGSRPSGDPGTTNGGAGGAGPAERADDAGGDPRRPEPLSLPVDLPPPPTPASGAGGGRSTDPRPFRLVAGRTLYDRGTAVGAVPALARLVPTGVVRAHPDDLDELGVTPGEPVRLRGDSGSLVVPTVADRSLPRWVVSAAFNTALGQRSDGSERTIADFIDIGHPVVELAVEAP